MLMTMKVATPAAWAEHAPESRSAEARASRRNFMRAMFAPTTDARQARLESLRELPQPFEMAGLEVAVNLRELFRPVGLLAKVFLEVIEREPRADGCLHGLVELAVVVWDCADHLPLAVQRGDVAVEIPEEVAVGQFHLRGLAQIGRASCR